MKSSKGAKAEAARRRICIIDDHPITRKGLTELIKHERDLIVCGEADNAARGLTVIKSLKPDLALLDLTLPNQSGLDLIKDIRLWAPEVRVLVLSMHDEGIYAERVLRAGGHGYIMKNEVKTHR